MKGFENDQRSLIPLKQRARVPGCVTKLAASWTRSHGEIIAAKRWPSSSSSFSLSLSFLRPLTAGQAGKKAAATIGAWARMKSSSLMHRCLSQPQYLKPDSTHLRHYPPHPHGEDTRGLDTTKKSEREKEREKEMEATHRCITSSRSSRPPLLQNGVICRAIICIHPRTSSPSSPSDCFRWKRWFGFNELATTRYDFSLIAN